MGHHGRMHFAVVEYNSKSGKIWKHTPERPNYLADPQKEIDPTSFGGYVSALHGEHIPLLHFVGVNTVKKIYKRLADRWPKYSLDYLKQFDTLLVVHQISDAHEMANFVRRVRKELPHIFTLGVPTQPFGILRPHIDSNLKAKQEFVEFLDNCHVFISVVKATNWWYERVTKTPVVYVPQIYPAHFASQFFLPLEKKEKIIFVAGITDRPNISQGFLVAKQLQQEFPEYIIHATQIPSVPMDFSNLKGARYEIQPFREWRQQLPYVAKTGLVINTDHTLTRGRVQADAAAVGTPSLGGNSDAASDLFPELSSTPETSTEELIAKGRKLLIDNNFYKKIIEYASDKIKKYDYEESAARLQLLVKQHTA